MTYKKNQTSKNSKDTKKKENIKHIMVLIDSSKKAMDGRSESLDQIFKEQIDKLKKELASLEKNK